jgi:uncharacterized membrane protein YccC
MRKEMARSICYSYSVRSLDAIDRARRHSRYIRACATPFSSISRHNSAATTRLKRWEVERDRVRAHIIEQGWSLEPLDSRAEAALRALGRPLMAKRATHAPDYAAFDNALERLTAVIPAIPATSDAAGAMSPQRTTKAQRLIERLSEQASPSRDQVPILNGSSLS